MKFLINFDLILGTHHCVIIKKHIASSSKHKNRTTNQVHSQNSTPSYSFLLSQFFFMFVIHLFNCIYVLHIHHQSCNQRILIFQMIEIIITIVIVLIVIIIFALKRTSNKTKASPNAPPENASEVEVKHISLEKEQPAKSSEIKPVKEGKKKRKGKEQEATQMKNAKQLEQSYPSLFYGVLSLKANNSLSTIDAVSLKNAKILVSNSKNELVLFDLKRWKKDSACQDRYFTSLDNNQSSAIAIGNKYYYAALNFEKTIAYYEFLGGEKGIYFREVKKFARNLYKSDISSLYVPQSEKFIVGTGSVADTVINVWSMEGEKLAQVNTYQIEHYGVCYGNNKVLVRGWTSEVKLFQLTTDKEGYFQRIDKSHHLTHSEQPVCSAIDNLGLHAVTVCKSDQVKIWHIYTPEGHLTEKTIDAYQLNVEKPHLCAVHTLKDENDRLRTFAVLANNSRVVLCDRDLKQVQTIQGIEVVALHMTGTTKNAVLGTYSSSGKLTVWNISGLLQKMQGYVLPS